LRFLESVFNDHATAYTIVKCYKWLRIIVKCCTMLDENFINSTKSKQV
jgi:hypothetical protein